MFGFLDAKKSFWNWFVANSDRLLKAPLGPGPEFEDLKRRLHKVNPNLVLSLGSDSAPSRQLVISADGDRSNFHIVEELVDLAPSVPGWTIVRFKPREPNYHRHVFQMGKLEIRPEQIRYMPLVGWNQAATQFHLAVDLFIEGCAQQNQPEYVRVAFILVDGALCEYDVAMKMSRMRVFPMSAAPETAGAWDTFVEAFDNAFEDLLAQAANRAAAHQGRQYPGK